MYKNLASSSDRITIPCRIHRLVMLGFCYRPDHKDLVVNHIDGNPKNCLITNLEWATIEENNKHAWRTGLHDGTYSVDDVHKACKLLESGEYTVADIAKMTGLSYSVVSAILGKRTHTDISDQYNITNRKVASNLNENQVRSVCMYFQLHKGQFRTCNDACRAAMEYMKLDQSTNMLKTLQKIYSKQTYTYISKDYDF